MLAITNDAGETLQLTPGQNLVTEQNIPWLSDDELPGEFSYPIDAPLNEANKRFVQYGYRPDAALPKNEIAVTVRMEGVLYRRCTFRYRVNSGKLSGYLIIDASDFYDKIRKLTLLEALPDPVFLGDGLVGTPPVDLPTRLKQIAALKPGEFPCTFFPIRNELQLETDFDEGKLPGFVRNAYINAWEKLAGGSFGFPTDLPNKPSFGRLICPQFYLSYVLERIMTLAGYTIESDWLASEEVQRITIKNLTAMSQTVADLGGFITGHSVVPGLCLPDMSVGDFLKAVKGRFGLVFTYNTNSKICRITQFLATVNAGAAIDLTPYQSGDYTTNNKDGRGFAVSDYIDSADELYKDANGKMLPLPVQTIGKGQQAVTLSAGTCQLSLEASGLSDNARWFVPIVRQPGNVLDSKYRQSSTYLTKEGLRPNSVGLVFLSFRGMTTDSKNNPYPLATPDVRDGKQVVVGTQALTLSGRNGSWRNYLRAYYYFRDQTQPITQPLLLPVSVLASLELDRMVTLSLEDQIRRSYLISKVQSEAPGIDAKVSVRMDVLTLPSGIELMGASDTENVWVELILGELRPQSVPIGTSTGTHPIFLQSVTVRCWIDANRSQAATVTNLPVILRTRMPGLNTTPAQEYLTTYYVNGSSTLVEPDFVQRQAVYSGQPMRIDLFHRTIQLDPGEGYSILS